MRLKEEWLKADGPKTVCDALQEAGHLAYFVGGCVRNTLLNKPVNDIDMATDATPKIMLEIAAKLNLRVIPTGIDHGTVTFIINNQPIEVTTFRKDIITDGRHAVITFSTSIEDDARRRDFTMNALYADINGQLIDPLSGLDDLLTQRVRFIEDPAKRIQEDYLRILRFFRFHALYGDLEAGIDPDGLSACANNIDGVDTLSKERIGHEMRKLLGANNPAPSMAAMAKTGILIRVLNGSDITSLAPLIHLEGTLNVDPYWMRRLLAINGTDIQKSLRLSKKEAQILTSMRNVVNEAPTAKVAGYKLGAQNGLNAMLVLCAHLTAHLPDNLIENLNIGANASFPIKAADLSNQLEGPALGICLKRLETAWLQSNLTLSKAKLLSISGIKEQNT